MTSLLLVAWIAWQSPARDAAASPPQPAGTAVISGTITNDDAEGRPVRRVKVTLESGKLEVPQATVTDEAGRFAFAGLGPGNYALTASKASYVSTFYGANKPGRGPGVPIALVAGQRVTGLKVKMMRGAVITGTARLPGGQPAVGASVQTRQVQMINGQPRVSTTLRGYATADDRGEYRVFGLAPGDYVVQIQPTTTSFLTGGTDMRRISPEEIRSAEQALSQPTSSAGAPGASSSSSGPVPATEMGPAVNQALVFYPGTTDPSAASTVTVGPGQERTGIDVVIEYVPTARLAGTIVDPDGRPAQGVQLAMFPKNTSDLSSLVFSRLGARANPDGSFYANGVAPGRYVITARAAPRVDAQDAGASGGRGAAPPPPVGRGPTNPPTLWATAEIEVNGRDISDIALALQPGMTVTGRIAFEATTLTPPAPDRVRVSLQAASSTNTPQQFDAAMITGMSAVAIAADGTFTIRGAAPGMYRFTAVPPGATPLFTTAPTNQPWAVKSIVVNGRDVSDLPIEIKPGEDLGGVVITVTDNPTEISGTVLDQVNRPAPGFPIVVFPTNRAYWPAGPTRIRQVQPASDGKYRISGLPAGEYYVCAVTDVEQDELNDPAFLDSLAASAFKITIAPGEKKTQNLKLGGG